MTNKITSQWLESIVNKYIALDPEGLQHLAALKGKVLCVDVLGLNKQYYVFPEDERVLVKTECDGEPDTTIKGMPSALLKLSMQADTAPLMLSGEIEIIGDVRLGREFKKNLSNLNIDWEEHLSTMVGDVAANLAFNAFKQLSSWTKKTGSSLKDDVSEYLQEESRDVVSGAELSGFTSKVDQLRDDVERLAALIKRKSSNTHN